MRRVEPMNLASGTLTDTGNFAFRNAPSAAVGGPALLPPPACQCEVCNPSPLNFQKVPALRADMPIVMFMGFSPVVEASGHR